MPDLLSGIFCCITSDAHYRVKVTTKLLSEIKNTHNRDIIHIHSSSRVDSNYTKNVPPQNMPGNKSCNLLFVSAYIKFATRKQSFTFRFSQCNLANSLWACMMSNWCNGWPNIVAMRSSLTALSLQIILHLNLVTMPSLLLLLIQQYLDFHPLI